jgi:hypothetical protein
MKKVIFALGLVICVFACKKTESPIVPVPVAPIVQEESIKFTTSIDSGIKNIIDTLPLIVNVTSKIPASGIFFNVLVKLTDSSKVIFKIDTLLNNNSLSLKISGFNNLGVFNISVTLTSKSTSSNSLSNNYNYTQLLQINESAIFFNHSKKTDIYHGLDVAFNGTVDFINEKGSEIMILTPSIQKGPSPWNKLPTVHLVKKNGVWKTTNYYDNINFGMGGRDVEKFGTNGFLWSDTGPELDNNTTFPFNQIYIGKNITDSTVNWVQVSRNASFYHGGYSGDLNRDGLLDVVAVHMGTTGNNNTKIHTFLNNGGDNSFSENNVTTTKNISYSAGSIIIDDIDNDNLPEIIKGDYVHYYTPNEVRHSFEVYSDADKDGMYTELKFNLESGLYLKKSDIGVARIKLYDYDGDGLKDIFAKFEQNTAGLANYGAIQLFHNDGKGVFTPTNNIIELTSSDFLPCEFDLFDVNNDGKLDIVFNAFKNRDNSDLVFQYGSNNPKDMNSSATIDFDQLIYYNIGNGVFQKKSMGFKHTFQNGGGIVWVKGFKINNKFKFVCVQKNGDFFNPSSYTQKIIEVFPKF